MATTEGTATERVIEARRQHVARGVNTPPLVVARAEGARITDVDGREFIDFAGGLGCQNLGHGFGPAVDAMRAQLDQYLHQCFMVGMYEPYIETCRRLNEHSPCSGGDQRSLLVNSGAEAVENAVKVARAYTGRPGVICFDHGFHGRTILTLAMTSKVVPYKKDMGPLAPDVFRAPAPYPYYGIETEQAIEGLHLLFKQDVDPERVACMVLEPVQGEGGFIPMPKDFIEALVSICKEHGIVYVDDEVQAGAGRTGTLWAIEHYGVEPDLLVSGKSLGGGMPLAAITGRAELMDAVPPGGLGGTFGGNPLACAAANATLDALTDGDMLARAQHVGEHLRKGLDNMAQRIPQIGEVRGIGPMLALELVHDPEKRTPAPELAAQTTANARERGLMLLSCGLYGNVLRILVPFVAPDEDLDRGLEIMEESLGDAIGAAG
ncbi:MAG TPA: 4-aminobutyrate--2-oxoglutarate transaminase [Thermoleophilaceae bacterium]|nr:4-aminobutyrate--2-oxoglutarate transaminase [Thermoleophilaceae bacterium]